MANVNIYWDETIAIFTAPTVNTASTYTLTSTDGLTRTVFTSGNNSFTYSGNTPTVGTITSIRLELISTGQIMNTITGINVSLGDVGALATLMANVRSGISWQATIIVDQNPTIATSTQIRLSNNDGTFTDIIGTGLNANGGPPTGLVTSVVHLAANGTTVLDTIGFANAALGLIAGALFDSNAGEEIYLLINSGSNTITGGANGISFGGNVYYTVMLDGPGNDTITASGTQITADYGLAAAGITANLTTLTVSGGGADTLVGVTALSGSNFDDLLTGSSANNYIAGDSGNDTLDGGLGVDGLHGDDGNDVMKITTAISSGELFDGGDDTDTISIEGGALTVTPLGNQYSAVFMTSSINSIEKITFQSSPGNANAVFLLSQVGSGIATAFDITGDTFRNTVALSVSTAGTYSLPTTFAFSNWTPISYANFTSYDSFALQAIAAVAVTLNGTTNGDVLIGNTQADTLNGGDGNDVLSGGPGGDVYNGGNGDDILAVGSATNLAYTENYALDTFNGGANLDSLGVNGNVLFNGTLISVEGFVFNLGVESSIDARWSIYSSLGANAQILGAAGVSQAIYIDEIVSGAPVTIDISGWSFLTWTTYNFATPLNTDSIVIDGSNFADTITGSSQGDFIGGWSGDDVIHGGASADELDGWAGRDQLFGDAGDDHLYVVFNEVTGNEVLDGGADTDTLHFLGSVNATAFTLTSLEKFVADPEGGGAVTEIFSSTQLGAGLASNLNVNVDRSISPTQSVTVQINYAATASVNISGWTFGSDWKTSDHIEHVGSSGNDTMVGTSGWDVMIGNGGADNMTGGLGDDTYYVDNAGDVVTELPSGGLEVVWVSLNSYVAPANVENVFFTGTGTFVLTGSTSASLFGGASADTLIGSSAGGFLSGGDGADVLWFYGATGLSGGNGFDYAIQLDAAGQTRSIGSAGIEVYVANSGNDTINATGAAATTIIYGGAGNDAVTQSVAGGYAFGQDGNDTLTGGDGQDIFLGGAGFDTILGNGGNDVLYIDSTDALAFDGGAGVDYAIVDTAAAVSVDLTTRNVEVFIGNLGNDTINAGGTSGPMGLYGFGGDDVMTSGTSGGNQMFGQDGNDILNSGAGGDVVLGGNGNDQIFGNAGDDLILGEVGNDTIVGGTGADVMWGGAGDDTFRIAASDLGSVQDLIADFGDTTGDNDLINFTGITSGQLTITNASGGALLSIAGGYSLFVIGATATSIVDDLLFS